MKNQIFIYLVLVLFVNISFSGVYKFLPGKLKQFNSYVILGDVEEETNKEESASGELDKEYILANNIIPALYFTTQSYNSCNEGEDPSRISLEKETPPPEEI